MILILPAQTANARSNATATVILCARHRKVAVDWNVTRAELERAVEKIDKDPNGSFRKERPEVFVAVILHASRGENPRKRFNGQFEVRVAVRTEIRDIVYRPIVFHFTAA